MSITIRQLNKSYGNQHVLKDGTFSIATGEIVGFIGPNGAGKSTTMKCITGYLPYDSGKVEVCGVEVSENPIEIKRRIGYLPEHNPLYLDMYVREYLTYVGRMYGLGNLRHRVNEIVERVGLTPESDKRIVELSKGYRQRVGLAQALIHDPEVLILDEPTTGLDPNQLRDVRQLISEIGKEKTVMLSTHIMQEVKAICDRVIIISGGKIVADESEQQIVSMTETDGVYLSVELGEDADESYFSDLAGIKSVVRTRPRAFTLACTGDIRRELSSYIVQKGGTLLMLSLQERNMEDVFRDLTQGGMTQEPETVESR